MKGLKVDLERLRGALTRQGVRKAEHLGIHQVTVSRKLHGVQPLTIDDFFEIARFLSRDARS